MKLVASGTGAALAGFSPGVIKVIGVLEVLAAVGLVVPLVLFALAWGRFGPRSFISWLAGSGQPGTGPWRRF